MITLFKCFTSTKSLIFLSLFSLVFISCKSNLDLNKANEVVWDRETCAHCGMLISDRNFASQIRDKKGRTYFFDDIGCAIDWEHQHKENSIHRTWVRSKLSKDWIDAKRAYWIAGALSPMGYGYSASLKETKASISFSELKSKIKNYRLNKFK